VKNNPTSDTDVGSQLILLRGVTKLTGAIHEAQIEHLKHWPYALQQSGLNKFEIKVDQEGNIVYYELSVKGKVSKNLELLPNWVKWLLGDEWEIKINVNGKNYFDRNHQNGRKGRSAKRAAGLPE
jgi:hypothetical protein